MYNKSYNPIICHYNLSYMLKFFHRHYHLKYKHVYRHAKKLFVFDLGLVALAIVMFGVSAYFFFWLPGITDLVKLNLTISSHRVLTGDEIELTINLKNNSELNLLSPTLKLELPNSFIIDRDKTPTNLLSDKLLFVDLPTIKAKESKTFKVYGWIWTAPQKEVMAVAKLSYTPQDTNRNEKVVGRTIINLPDSNLKQTLTGNDRSVADQNMSYKYILENQSKYNLKNITLKSNWPNLQINSNSKKFNLDSNDKKEFNLTITTPSNAGSYKFNIYPILNINNQTIEQNKIIKEFEVISPHITSQIDINYSYISPNQIIPIKISWNNNSSFALQKMDIDIDTNKSSLINWQKTAQNNKLKIEDEKINITDQQFKQLTDIKQNSKNSLSINLYTANNFLVSPIVNYLELTPQITAYIKGLKTPYSQKGISNKKPLASQVIFDTQTRYYTDQGDQVGRGFLPPKVGYTTKYYIYIQITPYFQAVKNLSFKTTLPAGVELGNRDSVTMGKKIKFNPTNREVTWQYDNILTANSLAGIYFEVQTTPTIAQLGQAINLTGPLSLTATDITTGKVINIYNKSLNNILPNNDFGSKKEYKVVK